MDFLELAKARYSCRKFSDRAVEKDKLDKIIEAAIAAPTAKNIQPWKLWVLQSEDALVKVRSATPCHFGASVVLALGGYAGDAFVRPSDNRNFEDVDAAIVGTHIMMEVQDIGLGTTWVGFFDEAKMKELFSDMAEYDLVALFPIGYPADDVTPADRHGQRKAKEALVRYV